MTSPMSPAISLLLFVLTVGWGDSAENPGHPGVSEKPVEALLATAYGVALATGGTCRWSVTGQGGHPWR